MVDSAKGLFPAPAGKGLPLRAYNQRKKRAKVLSDRDKLNRFADLLAEGYEPAAAALIMGCVPEHGATLLARICKKLGRQAR